MCSVSPLVKQIWTTAGVLLVLFGQGMSQGFMSVLLTALKRPDFPFQMDLHMASWLVSAIALSIYIGVITSSVLMAIYGRKTAFVIEVLPGITSTLLIYFGTNFRMLLAARILDGITAGGTIVLGTVVIGEYTCPLNRGMFLNLKIACLYFGSTVAHCLGYYINWRTVSIITLLPYSLGFLIALTWKESPAWLAYQKRFAESEASFIWLRGDSEKSRKELHDLIRNQEARIASKVKTTLGVKVKEYIKKFGRKDFLKPVFIMLCGGMLLELCGRHLVPAYSADIVEGIVGNRDQSFAVTLTIDFIVTISATSSSILIKLMKTRTLLFTSGIASLVVLANACLYLFLASQDIISRERTWIPLTMFIMYFIFVNLGCTPVPIALLGEIFPLEHKSSGILTFSMLSNIILTALLKVFPYLLLTLEIYGTFSVIGVCMAILLVILYFILPETKGRTLQEIEDCIKGKVRYDEESCEKMLD